MKLATFTHDGATRLGCVAGDQILDLAAAAPDLPRTMIALLEAGPGAMAAARNAERSDGGRIPLAQVRLEAPIARPPKFLAIGLNSADHIAEARPAGYQATEAPILSGLMSSTPIFLIRPEPG